MEILKAFSSLFRYRGSRITPEKISRQSLDSMLDYIIVTDRDWKISIAGKSLLEAAGISAVAIKGKDLSFVFCGSAQVERIKDALLGTGKLENFDGEMMLREGKKIPVFVNGSVIRDRTGLIAGFVLVMRDMKEIRALVRKLGEKTSELEKSNDALKQKVNEIETISRESVGRELEMVEIKKKIKEIEAR